MRAVKRRFRMATPLEVLEEIAPAIVRSLDTTEIVETVAKLTRRVIDYQNFRLYRWDPGSESLRLLKSVARAPQYRRRLWLRGAGQIALGQGITGMAAKERRTILVKDASRDPRIYYAPGAERLAESVLCVPMVAGDELIGVMSLARLGAGTLGAAERRLMEAVAAQTALALVNAERFAQAERTITALAAHDRTQREFILVASHELRGPLTVIGGYASMLGEGAFGAASPQMEAALQVMSAKVEEMQALVERMLQVARLEEGLDRYQSAPHDVGPLVAEAAGRILGMVAQRRGSLGLDLPEDGPVWAEVDLDGFGLVLDNLLQNAVKFSLEAPVVTVRLRRDGEVAEVRVEDRGPGIPAEHQDHLFEKFFRPDNPQLRHVGGTGLGLYLARRVVEAMGGSIALTSVPGEGTVFTVRVPAAAPPAERAPERDSDQALAR